MNRHTPHATAHTTLHGTHLDEFLELIECRGVKVSDVVFIVLHDLRRVRDREVREGVRSSGKRALRLWLWLWLWLWLCLCLRLWVWLRV